jgi:hypothetical protein
MMRSRRDRSLLRLNIKRCGIIWHELGHTHLGADENGEVFTNELQSLRKKFTKEDVASYVTNFRKVGYFAANAVDPCRDRLIVALRELDIDLLGAMKKLEDDAREAVQKKLVSGFTLTGQPARFKGRAGALEDLPNGVDSMQEGAQHHLDRQAARRQPRHPLQPHPRPP